MPILTSPLDLIYLKGEKRSLLGLDVGDKVIGLSLSDILWYVATPYTNIQRKNFKTDRKELKIFIEKHSIAALVVGLPLNMNGTEGPRVQSTKQFVRNFLDYHDIPVCFWDERLSTSAVERMMIDADLSRQKREKRVDQLAASFILQGVLDMVQHHLKLHSNG